MRRIIAVICLTTISTLTFADDKSAVWEALVGKSAPIVVATPATGPVAKANPFNPQTFGKVRGFSPAGSVPKSSFMVYMKKLDEQSLALIRKLDEVAKDAKVEGSFVHIFDAKGAQAGGYTADEVISRIKELETVAKENKLANISLGIAASPLSALDVGLDDTHPVAVAVVRKSMDRYLPVKVEWYKIIEAKTFDSKALEAVANATMVELKK